MNRSSQTARDLYECDLAAWADEQVAALRNGYVDRIDFERLSAEISALGEREIRDVTAALEVLLTALLRWAYEVDLRCRGWAASIHNQRARIAMLLDDSPSLESSLDRLVAAAYPRAKARAVLESALFDESFPEGSPFTSAEIRARNFLPDPFGDEKIRGTGWWRSVP